MRNVIEVVINIVALMSGIFLGTKIGTDITETVYREQMIEQKCAYYNNITGEFTIGTQKDKE